jgi:hypothetical protein
MFDAGGEPGVWLSCCSAALLLRRYALVLPTRMARRNRIPCPACFGLALYTSSLFQQHVVLTKHAWVAATTSEAAALAAAKAKEAAAAALSQASSAFGFLKNSVAGTSIGSSLLSKVGNLSVGAGGDDGMGVRAVQSSIISCRKFPRLQVEGR